MKYIIILFFLSIIGSFVFLSSKYKNPYKLIHVLGAKGSGKSCLFVNRMLYYQKRGYIIYTDMLVNIPDVRIIDANDLKNHWPDEKCAIFLDEAGITFDSRSFKSFDKGLKEFFALQRKCRAIVYLNSQSYDIDKAIRDRCDNLILQSNIGNVISISRPILRKVRLVESTAEADSRIAEDLVFDKFWHFKFYYMPRYFKYFNSFDKPVRPSLPYNAVDQTEVVVKHKRVFFRRKKARPADSAAAEEPLDTDCFTTTKQSVTEDERQLTDFTQILYNDSVQGFGQ